MIIGNGMIARAMKGVDDDRLLIFASGVSNSSEIRRSEFARELNLLISKITENPEKKLLYFSTASIYDLSKKNSKYTEFKLQIEAYIQENVKNYIILRVGNVISSGGNANTMINFFKYAINNDIEFNLSVDAIRYFIDIEDVRKFILLNERKFNNQVVDLYYPYPILVLEIVKILEDVLSKKATYRLIKSNSEYRHNIPLYLKEYFREDNQYINKAIKKYINFNFL